MFGLIPSTHNSITIQKKRTMILTYSLIISNVIYSINVKMSERVSVFPEVISMGATVSSHYFDTVQHYYEKCLLWKGM